MHQDNFIRGYKVEIEKVRDELVFLKEKQQDLMFRVMKDDRITNLKRDIKWFTEESTKLNEILEQ